MKANRPPGATKLLDYAGWTPDGQQTVEVPAVVQQQPGGDGCDQVDDLMTARVPVMVDADADSRPVRSITESLLAIATLPLPIPRIEHKEKTRERDIWFMLTILVALVASIASTIYYYNAHEILLYGDSHSHLGIARRLFDSSNPWDITQLGAVWLPLPHILMWPFVWNDFLWHSGLAGSIVSMSCYLITSYYIYRTAYRLTHNGPASLLGTLTFILNPDVLYIQTTPLSEMVCAVTFMAATYYFLCWVQEESVHYLVISAFAMFLATLSRYDNWVLFAILMLLIVLISAQKRYNRTKTVSMVIIYGTLAGFGIMLWIIWNKVIFGDALYFGDGPYSSGQQQLAFLHVGRLYTYHNMLLSVKYYGADMIETLGPLVVVLAIIGLILFIGRRRFSSECLVVLALLTPFAFYVFSLYTGQAIIYVPGMVPHNAISQVFNVRYGIAMAAPCGVLIAILIKLMPWKKPKALVYLGRCAILSLILIQVFLTSGANIDLEDGQYGISCEVPLAANKYLAQYYNGGKILEDNFASSVDGGDAGFNFSDVIYEGSGDLWNNALHNPATYVTWVVADPSNPADTVSQQIGLHSQVFLSQFTLVASDKSDILLYHRNSDPLVKVHTIPANFLSQYALCAPH